MGGEDVYLETGSYVADSGEELLVEPASFLKVARRRSACAWDPFSWSRHGVCSNQA